VRLPVSVKGVVIHEQRVLLAFNDRQEWELPGGRLEVGETPEACVAREIEEETSWQVKVADDRPLDVWIYQPLPETLPDRRVLIVTYGCVAISTGDLVASHEHGDVALIPLVDLEGLRLPEGYRQSITNWAAIRGDV
jgi:8-oxo-dGTP pyrophosphatase MutT (NUDIX family)